IVAEIGINHNGSLEQAKKLIDGAAQAGCDAVKFQKRTPELCVPLDQWGILRETPWGSMTYIDYRRKVELSLEDYAAIDRYARELSKFADRIFRSRSWARTNLCCRRDGRLFCRAAHHAGPRDVGLRSGRIG